MPRCCNTVKKINSQPDLIRHTKKKTIGGLKRKVSEHRGVRKVHTDITASQVFHLSSFIFMLYGKVPNYKLIHYYDLFEKIQLNRS